jgi:hypothetical protein
MYFQMISTSCDFNLLDQEDKSLWEWITTKITTKLSVNLMKIHQKLKVKFTSIHSLLEKLNSVWCEFSNRKFTSTHIISTSINKQYDTKHLTIKFDVLKNENVFEATADAAFANKKERKSAEYTFKLFVRMMILKQSKRRRTLFRRRKFDVLIRSI